MTLKCNLFCVGIFVHWRHFYKIILIISCDLISEYFMTPPDTPPALFNQTPSQRGLAEAR